MMQVSPVFINQPARDCIVVDSHRYCREEDLSAKQVISVLVITALIVAAIGVWLWATIEGPLEDYSLWLTLGLPVGVLILIGAIYAFLL